MKKVIITTTFILFFCAILFAQKTDFNHINFNKADAVADNYKNESLTHLPLLVYKLTHGFNTDAEKLRVIYYWICHNVENDYNTGKKIVGKGKKHRKNRDEFIAWNNNHKQKIIDKLFIQKKTVCTGYALLLREMCRLANIECEVINGYYKSPSFDVKKPFVNHSWNAVRLNSKWYLCDATLASGYFDIDANKFIFQYNDGYFLTTPMLFVSNHFPEDKEWMLINDHTKNFTDFASHAFVYGKTFEHSIAPLYPQKLKNTTEITKGVDFELKINDPTKINDLEIITSNGWRVLESSPKKYSYENGILKFNHKFAKKGLYDVHIKIANDIVTTYTIDVL